MKTFEIDFKIDKGYLCTVLKANNRKEAIEQAKDRLTLKFSAKSGITECVVRKYSLYDVLEED